MLHPSSHKTPNENNEAVLIFREMWIFIACLIRPDSCSVAIGEESIELPSGSLDVIPFEIITGAILLMSSFHRCIFTPDSVITIMMLL